jgi:chromosome segregation ATPase
MAESDPALSVQDSQTANTRVGGVENRLATADRLANIEGELAAHSAIFAEREKAEQQAQTERQLAAAAVQQALQEAASASAKALEAALKNANELELERVARVRDEVKEVKESAAAAVRNAGTAQNKFEEGVRERFAQVNEFRGSLEDLGKSMGTRRELETVRDTGKSEVSILSQQLNDLRSRIDVGPKGLLDLQSRSDEGRGRNASSEVIFTRLALGVSAVAALIVAIIYIVHG